MSWRTSKRGRIKAHLQLTNKRLDDVNLHLAGQSRRIDTLCAEHYLLEGLVRDLENAVRQLKVRLAA